jgi:membrane protease YdiL (CAAX protease family)
MQLAATLPNAPLNARQRIFAAIEVVIGAAVVIGHNVYHRVPNEVPILVLLLWASLLVRRRPWASVGLCRPASWKRTLMIAACAGVLLELKDFVTEPVAHMIWHQNETVSSVLEQAGRHDPWLALQSLLIVWTFAAFGEEIGYRALLLRRTADVFNGSRWGYAVAVLLSSVLFGFGHFYKGPTGIFDSTVSGLILAAAYLAGQRNLWAPILAHGIGDTVAVVATFLGY